MHRWGFVITLCYALVLVFLLYPLAFALMGEGFREGWENLFDPAEFRDIT